VEMPLAKCNFLPKVGKGYEIKSLGGQDFLKRYYRSGGRKIGKLS
jgi:hypothetical protein